MIGDVTSDEARDAIQLNVGANYSSLRRIDGATVVREHDAHWHLTGEPDHHWNGVTWARFEPDRADTRIEELLARFRERDVPIRWWVGPASGPVDLATRLEAAGLEGVWIPGMAASLRSIVPVIQPDELLIERARDAADFEGYVEVLRICYPNRPDRSAAWRRICTEIGFGNGEPLHHFVGRVDHEPVATGTLCLGAGVAGLYAMHTLPELRGRGYGAAMATALMRFAFARAYRVAVLQAAPEAVPLYERLGYTQRCSVGLYHWKT